MVKQFKFTSYVVVICLGMQVQGQTLPVFPVKAQKAVIEKKAPSRKLKSIKPAEQQQVAYATIKFISDAEVILYVDGDKKGILKKDVPFKINLVRGGYVIKAASSANENDYLKWDYQVSEVNKEILESIHLTPIILKSFGMEMVKAGNFEIGKYEVTQAQWSKIMAKNPSKHRGCDQCPVENVSRTEIFEFIEKLNAATGQKFRLPKETEWEYAAKGGNAGHSYKYSGGDNLETLAWYSSNSHQTTNPVGLKAPNELNIFDMSGNVWEWCIEKYEGYGGGFVMKGGGWDDSDSLCLINGRYSSPGYGQNFIGFRLAKDN